MPRYTFLTITVLGLLSLGHALYVRHLGAVRRNQGIASQPSALLAAQSPAAPLHPAPVVPASSAPPPMGPTAEQSPPHNQSAVAPAPTAAQRDQPQPTTAPPAPSESRSVAELAVAESGRVAPRDALPPTAATPEPAPVPLTQDTTEVSDDNGPPLISPATGATTPDARQSRPPADRGVASGEPTPAEPKSASSVWNSCGTQRTPLPGESSTPARPFEASPPQPLTEPTVSSPEAPEPTNAAPRLAQIACGVVTVVVPPQWQATQIPYGMQIRLLITPQRRAELAQEPLAGVWITYHSRSVADQDSYERLQQLCSETLRHAAGPGTVLAPPKPLLVDSWPGTRIDFHLPAAGPQSLGLRGFRAMIQTTSGICELHAMAPETAYRHWAADFEQFLTGMRLRPVASEERVATAIQAAAAILGPWTTTDRHVWLDAIGQITLEYDAAAQDSNATGSGPGERLSRAPRTGRFEATADALLVQWNDGARTRYGWTVQNGRLVLTDQEGRTTTLNRWLNAKRYQDLR